MDPLSQLVNHWKEIYSSSDPLAEIKKHDFDVPDSIKNNFQFDVYPEPFYGYLNEDISKDGLLLLINPGEFNGTKDEINKLNEFIKERYTLWSKEQYKNEKVLLGKVNSKSFNWRQSKKRQLNRIISPEKIDFLHTMELFPYHSKKWKSLPNDAKEWLFNSKTTKLNFEVIEYLVKNKKVNYVYGIGIGWIEIFASFGYDPKEYYEFKNGNGNYSHRLFIYKVNSEATPIVIYVGHGMNFPRNSEVVSYMKP